jgi:hypothetical protein
MRQVAQILSQKQFSENLALQLILRWLMKLYVKKGA